jgi:serine/threonine-protein kinase PknG
VDNAIQTGDRLELIDMGAVRRMDDTESAIYGTVGYQAPEVAEVGPSVASDLYTVARTLAVLTFDFQGYTNVFADSLPDPRSIEVFSRYESFYRLLVRATDPDPGKRFASAEEMADQLLGVLREVVALETGQPRPAMSTLFGPELRVVDTELVRPVAGDASALGADRALERAARRRNKAGVAPAGGAAALPNGAQGAGTSVASGAQGAGAPGVVGAVGAFGPPPSLEAGGVTGPAGITGPAGVVGAPGSAPAVPGQANGRTPTAPGTQPAGWAPARPIVTRLDPVAAVLALPVPHVDPSDPNAGFLAGLSAAAPAELVAALQSAPEDSVEKRLRDVRARLELGDTKGAQQALQALDGADDGDADWRVVWHRGLAALCAGDFETSALSFDGVYDAFPGEPAPKLALGVCAEVLGQLDNSAEYYRLVWTTDQSYVSAAFGLARVLLRSGDRDGAVRALESVPESSIHYTAARVAAIRARLRDRSPREPLLPDLRAAAGQVDELQRQGLDSDRREQLATEVLGSALDWVLAGRSGDTAANGPGGGGSSARTAVLGAQLTERDLRFGLERSYRVLARLAQQGSTRIELVERANRFRPRTWV